MTWLKSFTCISGLLVLGASSAAAQHITVPGVGWEGAGAGLAITNLDADGRPEMIVMAYDDPARSNSFRYRVGRNLNASGVAASWGDTIQAPGVGWEGQGADVVVTNLDNNNRPDMLLIAYDNPRQANSFRYRVGKNLNTSGEAASWSNWIGVPGVGWEGQGAGAAILNMDSDPRPELLLMAYDNPSRSNSFRYRIGYNLDSSGTAQRWDTSFRTEPGVGWEGAGAGVAVANLDNDTRPDVLFMAYDDPPRDNTFRYRVRRNFAARQPIWLEMDKLSSVSWPPVTATRNGVTMSLPGIYRPLGLEVSLNRDQGGIADPNSGTGSAACFSDAELDAFLTANRNDPPPAGSADWHMYGAFLTCSTTSGLLGIMHDGAQRRGFAMFMNAFNDNGRRMRTFAHELGHALCLYHNDGDAWRAMGPDSSGTTVMNQTRRLASGWGFAWSATARHTIYDRSKARWRPQSGQSFGSFCR